MTKRSVTVWTIAAALMICLAAPAMAQDTAKGDVAVTYTFLRDQLTDLNFPAGFAASFAGKINAVTAVVGEVGMNFKTVEGETGTYTDFMGGIRFGKTSGNTTPFFQVLAGGLRFSAGGESDTAFGIQPGAGVDVKVAPKIAVRVQGDYRYARKFGENINQFRFGGGVVFLF